MRDWDYWMGRVRRVSREDPVELPDFARWLLNRWNLSASDAGFIGSEYVDEPERIFEEVKELKKRYSEAMKENARLRRGESVGPNR